MVHRVKKAISPIGTIHENLIITPDGNVFALYRLSKQDVPLHDLAFFKDYIEDGVGLFSHDEFDYHVFDIPEGYDMDAHIQKTMDSVLVRDGNMREYYWKRAGSILKAEIPNNQYVQYLQVRLTKEVEIVDPLDFLREAKAAGKRLLKRSTGNHTTEKKPLAHYVQLEKMLYADLMNYKALDRVFQAEIERIIYYQFHRANTGVLRAANVNAFTMQEGILTNQKGYLTIEQLDKTHYIASLPLIETPFNLFGSAFVQQLRDTLPFPIETHLLIRFEHSDRDLRAVNKIRKRLYHQERDRSQTDTPMETDEALEYGEESLVELQRNLKETARLAKNTVFFTVFADTKEELDKRISHVQYAIKSTQFKCYQPVVDQLTLFHQSLLATKYTFKLFERETTAGYIWDLGINLERNIANKYGMPLGRIIIQKDFRNAEEARQNSSKLVWFNPGLTKKAIEGASATNGNTLIFGPPGQGKSVLVKYIFCWLPDLGQKVLYVDPKDETEDFFHRALEKYQDNEEFAAFVHRINFVRLSNEEKNRGLLDPLIFLEGEEAEVAARETLEELGEIEKNPETAMEKKIVIQRAVKEVLQRHPSHNLTRVIEEIRKKDTDLAEAIEGYDNTIGRVLFGRDTTTCINFDNPITVLGIAGLRLPTVDEMEQGKKLSAVQRVSQVIMENVYKLVNIFSTDRNQDAAIIFDEAGGMEHTASGREKMDDSLRKGRANNTDVYLVTQAAGDQDESKRELISYKFVFKPKTKAAQEEALALLDLEQNEENKTLISKLRQGTCFMQDHLGRTQPIVIDVLFEEWLMACSSTDRTDERVKEALELEKERGI